MRNLRIVAFSETSVEGDLPLTATTWDASNDSIICAFGPTPTRPIIELKRRTKIETPETQDGKVQTTKLTSITSWDAPCPIPDLQCDEVLLMHYFSDTLTICLVLAGGDLVLVREEPEEDQERIEIVGSVDAGIAAAAWASDEEVLAIVTRTDNLVLMSRDLEPMTETTMTTEDLHASKHVSVGWGKKETQFHGKRAKAMRDPTMPEHVDEGAPSPYDNGKVTISWRGDGAYLAVNAVIPNHRRVIRVYSRECVLDSVSEPVDGLEPALSWRPAGNLIASIKRSTKESQSTLEVVFFERNGLRHGEFPLRLKSSQNESIARDISLAWNIDSSVLAVSFQDSVQFWTMGNYHYYLKQEAKIPGLIADRSTNLVWHHEKPLKWCASAVGSLIDVEYQFHVSRGSTIKPFDHGIVAVIDGTKLKLTPLRNNGVPPPMAFCEMETTSNIVDVAISPNGRDIAVLTEKGIELGNWQMRTTKRPGKQGESLHSTVIDVNRMSWWDMEIKLPDGIQYTQILFHGNKNDIFVFAPAQRTLGAICFRMHFWQAMTSAESLFNWIYSIDNITIPNTIQCLASDSHQDTIWAQDASNTAIIGYSKTINELDGAKILGGQPNSTIFKLQSNPDAGLTNGHDARFYKVSLTSKGSLLVNDRTLARDCTSFVLTDLYLIYTTAQHLLKFVHLTKPDDMNVPNDTPEIDERCRSIERGARIVTVVPSIYAVVLQMPRGNLETIYPRVLVLTGIRESLRNLEYRTAFIACQNHQVDMNILHDYMPEVFMTNVKSFIDDLKRPSRVDEFLSKLKEEDVTHTLYRDTLNASTEGIAPTTNGVSLMTNATHGSGKVSAICDAFIAVLKSKPGKFLQCIITAHVCKRPPDLKAALMLVSSLRQTSPEEADLAVSHLCFLTDTNRLFDAALAIYDLELTLIVAQNAQRDPREYMPFLQNLQSLPSLRRQYQIDNHLHNYAKALTSLHALEAHDEVEMYTIKHILYAHTMDLYKYAPANLSRITVLYAEYLAGQSQHGPAANLYESLSLYTEAYPLYALAHQWRESLTCASLVPLPAEQLQELALSLATTCAEESRDYRSAATIHNEYLSSPSTAAKLLCKGSYFADATRILSLHNLAAQIPSTIDTGLTSKFSEILELVADCKSQLSAQVPRIQELRVKKAEDPLAFFGGDAAIAAANGVDIPDNISLAATDATTAGGHSLFTRYGAGSQGGASKFGGTVASNVSRKTSKTKRREERKRARGKKGSVYEEEYLVASVARLVEKVNGVHDEVGRLVGGLVRRGMREQAKRVGEVMREIVAACEKAKGDVWGVVVTQEGVMGNGDGGTQQQGESVVLGVDGVTEYRPGGADGVFLDSQLNELSQKAAPVVKGWKGDVLFAA